MVKGNCNILHKSFRGNHTNFRKCVQIDHFVNRNILHSELGIWLQFLIGYWLIIGYCRYFYAYFFLFFLLGALMGYLLLH